MFSKLKRAQPATQTHFMPPITCFLLTLISFKVPKEKAKLCFALCVMLILVGGFSSACSYLPEGPWSDWLPGLSNDSGTERKGTAAAGPGIDAFDGLAETILSGFYSSNPNQWYAGDGYIYDGWIYYINNRNGVYSNYELWKCRPDLSQSELVDKLGSNRGSYKMTPDGNILIDEGGRFVYNVSGSSVEESKERIEYRSSSHYDIFIYKDCVFSISRPKGIERLDILDIYDFEGNHIKTVSEGRRIDSLGIIDDAVYFLMLPDDSVSGGINSLMCHDMANDKTEQVFEFETKRSSYGGYYRPKAHYNNRNIIIETGLTSYIYMSVDDIGPKTIDFDFGDSPWDSATFIPSMDGRLYFKFYYYNEEDEMYNGYGRTEYYTVEQGSGELTKLKTFDKDLSCPLFAANGYLYYLDGDYNIQIKVEYLFP